MRCLILTPRCSLGQACTAGSRIFVQEGVYDKFLQGFTMVAEGLTKATGGPFDEGVQHGPQVSQVQYDVSTFPLLELAHPHTSIHSV